MKIITAASMLASVLCLPEPEAGLGVEDMDTLIRLVSKCQHQIKLNVELNAEKELGRKLERNLRVLERA